MFCVKTPQLHERYLNLTILFWIQVIGLYLDKHACRGSLWISEVWIGMQDHVTNEIQCIRQENIIQMSHFIPLYVRLKVPFLFLHCFYHRYIYLSPSTTNFIF